MSYNIEKANVNHLEEIYNLELDYPHLLLSKESLKSDLEDTNSIYLVATDSENKIVGVAGINILVDHADITMVLTKKEKQNLGIATLLLNNIIEKCKKLTLDSIFLEVRKSNIPAIKLYEKLGFKKISERKNYYADSNEDALIYILKIH